MPFTQPGLVSATLHVAPDQPESHEHVLGAEHDPRTHAEVHTGVSHRAPEYPALQLHVPGVVHVPNLQPAVQMAVLHVEPVQPDRQLHWPGSVQNPLLRLQPLAGMHWSQAATGETHHTADSNTPAPE